MSTDPLEPAKHEDVVELPSNGNRVILERALADVVDHARRLKMSCVDGVTDIFNKTSEAANDIEPLKSSSVKNGEQKARPGGPRSRLWRKMRKQEVRPQTPRGVQCHTAHLPVPPPPPPPSPRCPEAELVCLALDQAEKLIENYRKTDELVDQLLEQAAKINREVLLQCQLQRETELVRDMEVEYSEDYMYIMLEAIREEFESPEAGELDSK